MIRAGWRLEKSTMPKSNAERLAELSKDKQAFRLMREAQILPPCWGQKKGAALANKTQCIKCVEEIRAGIENRPEFAEFIGILLGDGHLEDSGITIVLNFYKEKEYAAYVSKLVYGLFGKEPQVRYTRPTIRVRLNSILVVEFLKKVGLKTGKKGADTHIPALFWKDKLLLSRCIRGLIDTDGGIHRKTKFDDRHLIAFKNFSQPLLEETKKALEILGFRVSKGGPNSIRVQRQSEIKKYLLTIGTSNNKNTNAIGVIFAPVIQRQDTSFPR